MNKELSHKIYRKRQNQEWWTDITNHYSSSGELSEKNSAIKIAKEYKKLHRSDNVKVVEVSTEIVFEC